MTKAQKEFVAKQMKIATDALMQIHCPPEEILELGDLEDWAYNAQWQLTLDAANYLGDDAAEVLGLSPEDLDWLSRP